MNTKTAREFVQCQQRMAKASSAVSAWCRLTPLIRRDSATSPAVQVCAFNVAVHGCDDERRSGCSHCKTGTGVEADLPG